MSALVKDKLFYTVGEVTARYGLPVSTLHYWEKNFTELKPKRNKKGNRLYTEDNILLLDTIFYLLKEKGYTIKGAKEKLKNDKKKLEKTNIVRKKLLNIRTALLEIKNELDKELNEEL